MAGPRVITIDWTISVGNLITTVAMVGTMMGIAWRLGNRFTVMERKVNLMFAWFLRQLDGKGGVTDLEIRKFLGEQ